MPYSYSQASIFQTCETIACIAKPRSATPRSLFSCSAERAGVSYSNLTHLTSFVLCTPALFVDLVFTPSGRLCDVRLPQLTHLVVGNCALSFDGCVRSRGLMTSFRIRYNDVYHDETNLNPGLQSVDRLRSPSAKKSLILRAGRRRQRNLR